MLAVAVACEFTESVMVQIGGDELKLQMVLPNGQVDADLVSAPHHRLIKLDTENVVLINGG